MLRRYGESVQEHQDDDQPVKRHRFDGQAAFPAAEPVPAAPAPTGGGGARFITSVSLIQIQIQKHSVFIKSRMVV